MYGQGEGVAVIDGVEWWFGWSSPSQMTVVSPPFTSEFTIQDAELFVRRVAQKIALPGESYAIYWEIDGQSTLLYEC